MRCKLECSFCVFLCSLFVLILLPDTGKQTRQFKSASTARVPSELCWSVVGSQSMLHLQGSSKGQVTTALFALNKLITRGGKKIVLEEGAAPTKALPGAQTPLGNRRFSIQAGGASASTRADSSKAGRLLPADDLPLLNSGHVFVCYVPRGGVVTRTNQFVFLASGDARKGQRICWCQPGFRTENELNSINIKTLTDIYGH